MRLRNKLQKTSTIDELLDAEAEEHDKDYTGKFAFGSPTLKFSKEYVWAVNNHAYKRETYSRGFIKRRLFEELQLEDISGKEVLDVGCGNGQHAVFMAMYGARVKAFDLSKVGIEMGKEMAKAQGVAEACEFRIANISKLPYEDQSFDIILHNAVLHHILKYPNVKEETFRVLKPGGKVIFVDGLRDNPIYNAVRAFKNFVKGSGQDLGDVDLEFKDFLQFCDGFQNVKLERRCLFESVKAGIAKPYNNNALVRLVIWLAKVSDDIVLKMFPSLDRYCTEIIGTMEKPQ
jgi:2-polyprenyl-3-methyl-5-hydroxy-6-metoxy-1,4-benzoquinol methylase